MTIVENAGYFPQSFTNNAYEIPKSTLESQKCGLLEERECNHGRPLPKKPASSCLYLCVVLIVAVVVFSGLTFSYIYWILPYLESRWSQSAPLRPESTLEPPKSAQTVPLTTSRPQSPRCQASWAYFPQTRSCYRVFNMRRSLEDGIATCTQSNGQLASIHSAEENDFLVKLALETLPGHSLTVHRIGGKMTADGSFKWVDGSEWDFNNWNTEDTLAVPRGDCVEMMNFNDKTLWNAAPCDWWRSVICKTAARQAKRGP